MRNRTITAEELAYIDRYLNDELAGEELSAFQARMNDEPDFSGKVREVQLMLLGIGESGLLERIPGYHREMTGKTHHGKVGQRRLRPWLVAAAAAVILSVSLWLFTARNDAGSALYAAYYKPDPGLMTAMGRTEDYRFDKAMVEYKNGDYRQSIESWQMLLDENPAGDTLTYFLGAAYQALNKPDSAAIYLGPVASRPQSHFYQDANWYLGLIRLKENRADEAKEYLRRSGRERANELLHKLEK